MHSTSVYHGLNLSVLRGTGGKALATDHRAEDLNVSQIGSVRLNLGVDAVILPLWALTFRTQLLIPRCMVHRGMKSWGQEEPWGITGTL